MKEAYEMKTTRLNGSGGGDNIRTNTHHAPEQNYATKDEIL